MFGGFFQKKNWVHCICFNAPPIWTNLLFVWITTSFKSRINAINLQNLCQCYMLRREAAVSWVMAQNVCNKGVSLTYFRNKCQLSSVSHELRLGILLSIFLSFVMSLYIWYMYICVYMCITCVYVCNVCECRNVGRTDDRWLSLPPHCLLFDVYQASWLPALGDPPGSASPILW